MRIAGRGRYGRETYPVANRALIGLSNRYLIGATPPTPSAFTVTSPTNHVVAAVNVTRRASGLFVLDAQQLITLAGPDTHTWVAVHGPGSATGGVPSGDWLIDIASAITIPAAAGGFSGFAQTVGAGNLDQTVTLVGINATPLAAGANFIAIVGTTTAGTLLTPGQFFASVFELP